MFADFQRQSAMDVAPPYDSHENISPNITQTSTLLCPSPPLQACSSATPLTSHRQVQDTPVLRSNSFDTQHPKPLQLNFSTQSSEDSPSLQLKVETPNLFLNVNIFSSPSSSDVEKDCVTVPALDHYKSKLSPEEKELPVTEKSIMKICRYKLRSWKNTARYGFGLGEAQVCQLESDYKTLGNQECAMKSYHMWKMENGYTDTSVITIWKMVEILHKSKEIDAINCLIDDLLKH